MDVNQMKARVTVCLLMAGPVPLCPRARCGAQPGAKHAAEGPSYVLVHTHLSGPAVGETWMGKASPLGQVVCPGGLWETSLHLWGLGCWMGLVGLAYHPGCWGVVD